jgi:hypothetical protein
MSVNIDIVIDVYWGSKALVTSWWNCALLSVRNVLTTNNFGGGVV